MQRVLTLTTIMVLGACVGCYVVVATSLWVTCKMTLRYVEQLRCTWSRRKDRFNG